ncbi:MAG TPA: hypothetical protein DGT21_08805, partial [Armatimonadetes bacterium]|nr:hypothetical protein [Armatimonadota bacterium]
MNLHTRILLTTGCLLAAFMVGCAGDSGLALRPERTSDTRTLATPGTGPTPVSTAQGELLGDLDNDGVP